MMPAAENGEIAVVVVVAVADNGVIGHDGDLPWRLPGDLARAKRLTMGKPLVMGRRTWESIGRPLPGRTSIVVTRDRAFEAPGAIVVPSFDAAMDAAYRDAIERGAAEIILFGGADIYLSGLSTARRIHMTEVHLSPEGDTRFPALDPAEWRETARERIEATGDAPAHDFVTLERVA